MKRSLIILALALLFALALTGCGEKCRHEWKKADCENARTCAHCGEIKGEALGHSWKAATCTSPKTCELCGKTDGAALEHSWKAATCQAPKTCTTCGATDGEVGEHTWIEANCMASKTCTTCGKSEGSLGDHEIQDATCEAPQTCAHCGLTVGEALGHDWAEGDCETPKTCLTCGMIEGATPENPEGIVPGGHVWNDATCEEPKHCENCDKTEGEPLGHNWVGDAPKTCSVCGKTEGGAVNEDPRFQTEKCKMLFGTWKAEITITAEDMGMASNEGSFTQVVSFTFNPDGTARIVNTIKNMDEYVDLMTAFMYDMFAQLGMNKEEADKAVMDEFGMTMGEYAAQECEANGNEDMGCVYYVENDKLYMGESWNDELAPAEIVVNGDTMSMYDSESKQTFIFVRA